MLGACAQPAPPQDAAPPPDTSPITAPPTTPPVATPPVTIPELEPGAGWTPLLGATLDGWSTWLTQDKGDPKGIFKVEDGVLRVLDVPKSAWEREQGYLATLERYRHYHLRFETTASCIITKGYSRSA